MQNDSIIITAKLDVEASTDLIKNDLKTIQDNINGKGGLKINCTLNDADLTAMQTKLDELSKGLTINLSNANLQQAKVEIVPDIKKGVLESQAKSLEKELSLLFSYGETSKLRTELMGLLNDYQKAYQSENGYGEQAEAHMQKIIDFARQYQQENVLINDTLRDEQNEIKRIRQEQQKVFITQEQMNALVKEASKRGTTAQAMLNSALPYGWYSDPNKTPAGKTPYYWSNYVAEINNINPFHEIVSSENDIIQGMDDIANFMSKSFTTIDNSIERNEEEFTQWVNFIKGVVGDVTGKNPFANYFTEFEDLLSNEQTTRIEQNAQTVQSSVNRIVETIQPLTDRTGAGFNIQINSEAINNFIADLNRLNVQGVNIDEIRNRFQNLGVSIEKITPAFVKLGDGAMILDKVDIKGRDAANNLVTYTENFNDLGTAVEKTTVKIANDFEKIRAAQEKIRQETDTKQKALNKYLALQGKLDVYYKQFSGEKSLETQFQNLFNLLSRFDNTAPIDEQQEAIIRLDNALKLIKIDIDDINAAEGRATVSSQEKLDALKAAQLHLLQQYEKLEAQISKSGATMSAVAVRDGVDYSDIFNKIIKGSIQSTAELKKAQSALTTIRNEFQLINAQTGSELPQNAIENFATNASKLHTRFESLKVDFESIKNKSSELSEKFQILSNDIKQFKDFDKDSIISKDVLKEQAQAYTQVKRLLDEVKASTASALKEQSKEESEYNKLTAALNGYIKSLQTFNNSSIANRNKGNEDIQSQMAANATLIDNLQKWQNSLKSDSSAENVRKITAEFNSLVPSIEQATKYNTELTQQLSNTQAEDKASAKLEILKNQMIAFANANIKAVNSLKQVGDTTFAAKWQELMNRLNSGNLDANAIQKLADDFRIFKGEVQSVGLATSRVFVNMGSQIRMLVTRYVSLYAVIGYIKKIVTSVKELDTAMINVRRVTDETAETYENFLGRANELARELHTTTSTLVEQVYQWAKLGYDLNQSLDLAKSSTIFAKVADIDENTAVTEMVATMKAFNIEAERSIDIVDKLDILNNKFAVSAAGLGEGLERSASALAATGNSLEQTLAMLTGAGEITQNLENTGNALKVMSLRLQNMRGKLEELNEPVDDLMEVSKVQTKILNLTHNQVDIFDKNTQEFRSTYDILEDISEIWNSLSSTSRASLTEVLFGSLRSNQGLALIQAFQTGQVQSALNEAKKATGTATKEYQKMMEGIQSQADALKGTLEEFANAFMDSDFVKGASSFFKTVVEGLTKITENVGSLGVALAPIFAYISGKAQMNILSTIVSGIRGITSATASMTGAMEGASVAATGLKTILSGISGILGGLAIGAVISIIASFIDKLIISNKEMEESIDSATDSIVKFGEAAKELEGAKDKIDTIAVSYSKATTTIENITERKQALTELQSSLIDTYGEEANGIDLVNGKYSEQIKKLKELKTQEEERFKIENAAEIAEAKNWIGMNVAAPKAVKMSGVNSGRYERENDREGNLAYYSLEKLDEKAINLGQHIDGIYKTLQGGFDIQGLYLSGTPEEATKQLEELIKQYRQLPDYDREILEFLEQRYTKFKTILENIKTYSSYLQGENSYSGISGMFNKAADAIQSAVDNVTSEPFYAKLDEASEKLQQLANPDGLSLDEYSELYQDVERLETELYNLAGNSDEAKQHVDDLFKGFKQGIAENGDGLENFVSKFKEELTESFKEVAETVTTVQDVLDKLSEGEGVSHATAWKMLEDDTEGYLQTIKLVNGEYVFAEEELIAYKDAHIKSWQEITEDHKERAKERVESLKAENLELERDLLLKKSMLQYELALGKITINSQADYDNYFAEINKMQIKLDENKKSIEEFGKIISKDNLLIEELNQSLGDTRLTATAIGRELNNAVNALEAEVDAIEDTIDSLNERKDILNDEKDALQDQLDILNEQKEALEETIKKYDDVADAIDGYIKKQTDVIQDQIEAMEEAAEAIKKDYDEQINSLEKQNDERDDAIEKEKALADLQNAQNQKKRVYSAERGWDYEASKADILKAQSELAKITTDEQIKALEDERDAKLEGYDSRKKEYETQIKEYEEYAKKYTSIANDIKSADSALLAEQILGSEWREKIEQKDEGLLTNYRAQYTSFNERLNELTNNEIAMLQASIDAKDAEIKKVDDEIKAYNKYKKTVQTNLTEAKSALEDYQNTVEAVKTNMQTMFGEMAQNAEAECSRVSGAIYNMQDEIWNNHNKIIDWINRVTNSFKGLLYETDELRNKDDFMRLVRAGHGMGFYANGGTNTYTGLAMLHGTKQKSETIFNANDSKKLYDLVHGTPNLLANVAKQANKIAGFTPVSNNSTSSVSVSIGQIVANNPQEFTQGLDRELDLYFRKKLTQSYVQ